MSGRSSSVGASARPVGHLAVYCSNQERCADDGVPLTHSKAGARPTTSTAPERRGMRGRLPFLVQASGQRPHEPVTDGTVSAIAATARAASVFKESRFSDHAPLIIDYDWS